MFKPVLLFILFLLPVFCFPEFVMRAVIDPNRPEHPLFKYMDGEKEIATGEIRDGLLVITKGAVPDGVYKMYQATNLLGFLPHKNGQLDGTAYMTDPETGLTNEKMFFVRNRQEGENVSYNSAGQATRIALYSNNVMNGKVTEYYDSGKIRSTAFYKNGKEEGEFREFFENGKISGTGFYKNGNLDGKQKRYDENGTLIYDANIRNGAGIVKEYSPEGKLTSQYQVVSNYILNGVKKSYDDTGKLWLEEPYQNGNLDGKVKVYMDGGDYKIRKYKNGVADGEENTYYKTGGLRIRTIYYDTDGKNSKWEFYGENGKLDSERSYQDGKITYDISYWENGSVYEETTYKDGDYDGRRLYKQYGEDGSLLKEYPINHDSMEGTAKEYFTGGVLKEESNYLNGKKEGLSRVYNEEGKLTAIETYKNGYLVNAKKYDELGKQILDQDYPYSAPVRADDSLQGFSDALRTAFFKTGKFTVLERTRMKTLLDEQKLQLSGITSPENAVQIGKVLNVKFLVMGSVSRMGSEYLLNIRMVNVENSEVSGAEMERGPDANALIGKLDSMAAKLSLRLTQNKPAVAVLDLEIK